MRAQPSSPWLRPRSSVSCVSFSHGKGKKLTTPHLPGKHGFLLKSADKRPHDVYFQCNNFSSVKCVLRDPLCAVHFRFSGPKPKNLGNNTKLMDWLPQNDLLGEWAPRPRACAELWCDVMLGQAMCAQCVRASGSPVPPA